jgi:hypothetical protein
MEILRDLETGIVILAVIVAILFVYWLLHRLCLAFRNYRHLT